ncbi:hypothetical protein J5S49_13605 [Virgibacillus halodenitrificans]|uniref:hypothetical protein n=1 Tax=Virgibacillus halodenitrificans TaxID=1482 RepID=UPI001F287CA5|nr:hypothetical protein [Virgibacillus halodenitrificans]MCG1029328.1 hypothetical protein [Virgibacillus halodenitrificans]
MNATYGKGLYAIKQDQKHFEVRVGYNLIRRITPKSEEEYENIQALLQSDEDLSDWKDEEGNNIISDSSLLYFFDDEDM